VKAILLPGSGAVEVIEHATPEPGSHDVVVRVRASALCRSDMSLYDGDPVVGGAAAGTGSVIPGHEPAGEVSAVGSAVRNVAEGDRVAVYLAVGCGHCPWCDRGYRMLCREWQCIGFDLDGGDAEYIRIPAVNCLPIPDDMTFEVAAVSTDMIGTQYSTQKRLGVSGMDTVAVSGVGPMGAAAILVAKARGAHVIAIDRIDSRLVMAAELGADHVIDARDDEIAAELRQATGGSGVDVGIECSGDPDGQNALMDAIRPLGQVAFIGESRRTTINPSDQFLRKMLTAIGGWYFATWEYPEIASFITANDIPVQKLITHRFSLDEAEEAFRAFDSRETLKAVFVP
jgi:propanol-preferring alcohol dehydrogenase